MPQVQYERAACYHLSTIVAEAEALYFEMAPDTWERRRRSAFSLCLIVWLHVEVNVVMWAQKITCFLCGLNTTIRQQEEVKHHDSKSWIVRKISITLDI